MTPETMNFYNLFDIIALFCDPACDAGIKVQDYIDNKVSWGSNGSVTFVTGKLVLEALKSAFERLPLDVLPEDFDGALVALNY